jgi:hypothetical protein
MLDAGWMQFLKLHSLYLQIKYYGSWVCVECGSEKVNYEYKHVEEYVLVGQKYSGLE